MPLAIQLDDEAYAVAKAFAEQTHCSLASAVSRLVVKSGFGPGRKQRHAGGSTVRFPLVHGTRAITSEDVSRLEDEG